MKRVRVSKFLVIILTLQTGAALILALAGNSLLDTAIGQFRENRLSHAAVRDITTVGADVASLEKRIAALRGRLARQAEIRHPSVQELKELTAKYHLRLRKLEKQSQSPKSESGARQVYSVLCLGNLEDQVAFLQQLEETCLLECDNIILQRYNEDGTTLALGLTLLVREI